MHRVIADEEFEATAHTAEFARELLAEMVRARVFDERAVALQRRGWMSGYPSFEGQEASQVGAARALVADDWLFPTYRANAMQLARGVDPAHILRFRRGFSEFETRTGGTTFPQATPIATQLPHAVGAAMAATRRADEGVVCAYFGDGATSEGDFHEALNVAGVFDAPVVLFCENNYWAISRAWPDQTAGESVAGRADAYGFAGRQVDGMDPLAVRDVVTEARESARAGDPVLVESLTYRRGAHTTSDDPDRYRDDPDLPDWRTGDPIDRYASYLRDAGVIDAGFVDAARETAGDRIDEAVAAAEETVADPETLFAHAGATLSERQERQRRAVERRARGEDERGG